MQGAAWESARPSICRVLGRALTAEAELKSKANQLDEAYRRTAENLACNAAVRIVKENDRDTLVLTGIDKLEEPASLVCLLSSGSRPTASSRSARNFARDPCPNGIC